MQNCGNAGLTSFANFIANFVRTIPGSTSHGFDDSNFRLVAKDREGIVAENVSDKDRIRNSKRFGA